MREVKKYIFREKSHPAKGSILHYEYQPIRSPNRATIPETTPKKHSTRHDCQRLGDSISPQFDIP